MTRPPLTQTEVNRRIMPHVPSRAWQSTVALVGSKAPLVGHTGTGTLFQIADAQFVVTAGHVIREMIRRGLGLGLGATATENLIAVANDWQCTVPSGTDDESDLHDVAVNRLPPDIAVRLGGKRFLRTTDIRDVDPGPKAVYSLFGYPGIWSAASRSINESVIVKPIEFTTYAHDGDVSSLQGYESRLHLLLSGGPEYVTNFDGTGLDVSDRKRQPVRWPRALKGVSGCSVWHIGDLNVPIDRWSDSPASAVGIVTGIYQAAGVIKVSRWTIVSTLIYQAYPDLRPALSLYRS